MKCLSLDKVIDWEIIALNLSRKEDLQLIQYANLENLYKPLIEFFYLEYTGLILIGGQPYRFGRD